MTNPCGCRECHVCQILWHAKRIDSVKPPAAAEVEDEEPEPPPKKARRKPVPTPSIFEEAAA